LLVYDITNFKSFESVSAWLLNIQKSAPENTQLILIGNKCDIDDQRTVTYKMGDEVFNDRNT
jgi:GTPase SAR1 family protein